MSHQDYLLSKKPKKIKQDFLAQESEKHDLQYEAYLERYKLDKEAYEKKWLPLRQSIFDMKATWFPPMLFQKVSEEDKNTQFLYKIPSRGFPSALMLKATMHKNPKIPSKCV